MPMNMWFVTPSERKLMDMELKNQLAVLEAQKQARLAEMEKATTEAKNIRDSNQLSSDVVRHKGEMEQQQRLARLFPSDPNDPLVNPENRDAASMVNAGHMQDQMLASQPLANMSSAMNAYNANVAAAPYAPEIGQTGAEATIGQNQASTASDTLKRLIAQHRMGTAPAAEESVDRSRTAVGNLTSALANQDLLLAPQTGLEKQTRTGADTAKNLYENQFWGSLDPGQAALAQRSGQAAQTAGNLEILKNPAMSRLLQYPGMMNILGQQMLGTSALPAGGTAINPGAPITLGTGTSFNPPIRRTGIKYNP